MSCTVIAKEEQLREDYERLMKAEYEAYKDGLRVGCIPKVDFRTYITGYACYILEEQGELAGSHTAWRKL